MSADDLTPPGSTVYSSDTMFVGDGTWDRTSNTFLLPNLQGLNFNTMRINGMGNRFRAQPLYVPIIRAHGILGAIIFLFIIPFAIFYVRFGRQPRWGIRVHIYCQILTLLLSTAQFALPFFAVGPTRSLTNPHHGIGVALYVLIIVQFLWGWLVYKRERRRKLPYAPVKAVLHRWIGRMILLLGLAQVPLGLTLYGSPMFLFVLYALVVFGWLLTYFVLGYVDEKNEGRDLNSDYSWASGSGSHVSRRRHSRFGTLAKAGAAAGGIGYLAHKLRNRNEAAPSRRHSGSGSFAEDEKISHHGQEQKPEGGGLGKKLLAGGLLAGLGYKLFGRRKNEKDDATVTSYDYTESDDSRRQEEGMSPPRPNQAAKPSASQPLSHRRSDSSMTYSDDYSSASPSRRDKRGHGLRNAVIGMGALGAARNLFKRRREKKEQRRIDEMRQQDIEDERIVREGSKRKKFTGDGYPRPGPVGAASATSTNLTPMPAGGAIASGAVAPPSLPGNQSNISAHRPPTIDGQPLPVVPPPPQGGPPHGNQLPAGGDVFTSAAAQTHLGQDFAAAGAAGAAAGLGAAAMGRNPRDRSTSRRRRSGSTGQSPVSVQLKMHSDGRHVTLRRLTEEEAAADRARRAAAGRSGSAARLPGASTSTISAMDPGPGGERWRRTAGDHQTAQERQQLQQTQEQLNAPNIPIPMPMPPPIPAAAGSVPGSVGSPGSYDGTATEAGTDYARNRRRRRAERAAAAQAKAARGGDRGVEFE